MSLCKLENQNNNATIWLAGDFNAPGIDWQTLTLKSDHTYSSVHNSLLATIHDYRLTQLVTEPTRLDNTLDLFLTDHASQIVDIAILSCMSDHDIVMATADINTKIKVHPPRKILLYSKPNWHAIW